MMLSDAPRYVRNNGKEEGGPDDAPEKSAEDEAKEIEGFFQSRL